MYVVKIFRRLNRQNAKSMIPRFQKIQAMKQSNQVLVATHSQKQHHALLVVPRQAQVEMDLVVMADEALATNPVFAPEPIA